VGWDEQVVGRAGEEGLDNVGGESARRSAGVRARVKPRAAAVLRACGGRRSEVGHVATSAWLPHDKEILL
jgi:hypothetical protein